MDEDLMRMKSVIETGHLPHDAAQPLALKRVVATRTENAAVPLEARES